MNTKTIKISAPEGYEIDKENSTFEEIVFKKKIREFPNSWSDLGVISGAYIDDNSELSPIDCATSLKRRNVFSDRELAEASLAIAQLSQLRKYVWNGWKPDWKNHNIIKYVIFVEKDLIILDGLYMVQKFLAFPTAEMRDKFKEAYEDLILKAAPILRG